MQVCKEEHNLTQPETKLIRCHRSAIKICLHFYEFYVVEMMECFSLEQLKRVGGCCITAGITVQIVLMEQNL